MVEKNFVVKKGLTVGSTKQMLFDSDLGKLTIGSDLTSTIAETLQDEALFHIITNNDDSDDDGATSYDMIIERQMGDADSPNVGPTLALFSSNTNDSADTGSLDMVDDTNIGNLLWRAKTSTGEANWGQIRVNIQDASDSAKDAKMFFKVQKANAMTELLTLDGGNDKVVVPNSGFQIGSGATVTTIATSTSLGTSNTTLSTTGAIKSYVDSSVSSSGDGTVTSVTAGTGMTQSGTSTVNPTLNVIGGTGITANANDIAIDSTVVTKTGAQTLTNKTITASQITEISALTAAEGAQLENIGSTTISATQWGYLGAATGAITNSDTQLSDAEVISALNSDLGGDIVFGTQTDDEVRFGGDVSGRVVNGVGSNLYRFSGLYFTWDADNYGTQLSHSITSTDNGSYSDDITINSYGKIRINMDTNNNGAETNFIQFGRHTTGTGGDTFMTIADGGNVGIGTTAPSNKLHLALSMADGDDGILLTRTDSSTSQNDILGGIGFDSSDGNIPSTITEASVALVAKAREDHGTGDKGGYLDFYYTPSDDDDDTTSRIGMRMMQGKLSVGGQNSDVGDPINSLVVEHAGSDWHNGILVLRDDVSISSGDLLGAIGFDGKDGNNPSNILEASAGIAAYAAEDHSTGDKGGDLAFFTSAIDDDDDTTSHERMRITSAGRVGIGTTSPDAPLHVEHSSGLIAKFGEGNVETQMTFADSRAMIGYVGDSLMLQGGSGSKIIRFGVNNGTFGSGEVARFDVNGNFGIGTTAPRSLLDVRGAAGSPGHLSLSTAETTVVDGDILGRIDFIAPLEADGTGDSTVLAAAIYAEADATFSDTVNTTDIVFATGNSEVATEKMRLSSVGQLDFADGGSIQLGNGAGATPASDHVRLCEESNALKIDSEFGYVKIGPQNASWSHFYTDRAAYYFDTGITVDTGIISSYNENLKLRRAGSDNDHILVATDSIIFTVGGTAQGGFTDTQFTMDGSITLKERAAAPADNAGYGQLWVKNSGDGLLYFTDDNGTDIQITTATAVNASSGSGDITGVTVTAGTGMTGGGTDNSGAVSLTLNVVGGTGITANANDMAVTPDQTGITSVKNAGLVVGRDADNTIDFGTDNEIRFRSGGANGVKMTENNINPFTDNDISLGTALLKYKEVFTGIMDAENIKVNGGQGTDGQVLTSTGSGVAWEAAGGGSSTDSFMIFGEESDEYLSATAGAGNANGWSFSYGNGAQNTTKTSSGVDFGIPVGCDCTLKALYIHFGNKQSRTGSTNMSWDIYKNGSGLNDPMTGNASGSGGNAYIMSKTNYNINFSEGDAFNIRIESPTGYNTSTQVGPARFSAYFERQ